MNWANWLWSEAANTLAVVGLAIAGLWDKMDQPWEFIVIGTLASFIVIHAWRNKKLSIKLGRNYASVQSRILRLLADLAEITASGYELWKVDVYLPEKNFSWSGRWFCTSKFSLELSVALTDMRPSPAYINADDKFFGECFRATRSGLWWDPSLSNAATEGNFWNRLDDASNARLKEYCGVINIHPIVDHLGKDCCGLLVVHTNRDPVVATTALGALKESESNRRLSEACRDVYEKLRHKQRASLII